MFIFHLYCMVMKNTIIRIWIAVQVIIRFLTYITPVHISKHAFDSPVTIQRFLNKSGWFICFLTNIHKYETRVMIGDIS